MSQDQGAGSGRERVVHDERADARERVRVAQDREAQQRTDRSAQAKDRARVRQRATEAEQKERDVAASCAAERADGANEAAVGAMTPMPADTATPGEGRGLDANTSEEQLRGARD